MTVKLNLDNRFAALPSDFYTRMQPEGFARNPYFIHANPRVAELIDLDPQAFNDPDFISIFCGNKPLECGNPLASVYAGHQFGHFVPQLGDGRALLLAQVRNKKDELWDIQLKGGGITPYSRFADGRAVMRSTIREYLCGEAMHALGIPTTRALCMVGTGEQVQRETREPGAILTRVAPSHIRFGHFEFFYHSDQHPQVIQLADHVIDNYFPHLSDKPDRYKLWFSEIVARTAEMIAGWQTVGFAHGVMNTDNMSILGLTIDYGPFGFMENFDHNFICNHSDEAGRYAFDQQPGIAQWNLFALAYALQPLFPISEARKMLETYEPVLRGHFVAMMAKKLGLANILPGDQRLIFDLIALLQEHGADYTHTFRLLAGADAAPWLNNFDNDAKAKDWLNRWRERTGGIADLRTRMNKTNPKYILRNWVAETVIRAAEDKQDYSLIDQVLHILQNPYDDHPDFARFAEPAPANLRDLCVSCSS